MTENVSNELILSVLRDVQQGLADVRREVAEHCKETQDGFARVDADLNAIRYYSRGLRVDADQRATDLSEVRARLVALERKVFQRAD